MKHVSAAHVSHAERKAALITRLSTSSTWYAQGWPKVILLRLDHLREDIPTSGLRCEYPMSDSLDSWCNDPAVIYTGRVLWDPLIITRDVEAFFPHGWPNFACERHDPRSYS